MPFNLTTIAILTTAALLYAAVLPPRWREWALFSGSIIAIYWFQPFLTIRFASFLFPTFTLLITITIWYIIHRQTSEVWTTGTVAIGLIFFALPVPLCTG